MSVRIVKLPDVGEGVAEAEIVEWQVAEGDLVAEDQTLAAVMTDKATVEIPSPVAGRIVERGGEIGTVLAVGATLVAIDTGDGSQPEPAARPAEAAPPPPPEPARREPGHRPLASPAVRRRALDLGIDLRQVKGSGPAGRIGHGDLDAVVAGTAGAASSGRGQRSGTEEVKLVGLRRRIAETMAATRAIAHFTYVEEVDVTALEDLRAHLNARYAGSRPRLTLLPFVVRAAVVAVEDFPHMNAHYDDQRQVVTRHAGVHIGIAAQTAAGLMVPVLRHAEACDLWALAGDIARLAEAARAGSIGRDELTGSTITVTSLGSLGGIATTPVINRPEVAIVGVNRIAVRPVWQEAGFVPRRMMNLSSSFDHRVIDGHDAARFVARIKELLETPAAMFVAG